MKSNKNVLDRIAEHTGIATDKLTVAGLEALLRQKKREIMAERLEILSRYGASSVTELEQKIKEGKVIEHPGWEDMILVENLEEAVAAIEQDIEDLRRSA